MFAAGVADEVVGRRFHRRFAAAQKRQLKERDVVGQRNVGDAVEEFSLRALVSAPVGELLRQVLHRPPVVFRHRNPPHHFNQHRMRRHFLRREPGEGAVADDFLGRGSFEKLGNLLLAQAHGEFRTSVPVFLLMGIDPRVEEGRSCFHSLLPAGDRQRFRATLRSSSGRVRDQSSKVSV